MMRGLHMRVLPSLVGGGVLLGVLVLWAAAPGGGREILREQALDRLLPAGVADDRVVIVDIDHDSLERVGPWPWPRVQMARLLAAVTAARPLVAGLEVLLAGEDRYSAAALRHWFPDSAVPAGIGDGDAMLAQAMAAAPVVLGFVFAADRAGEDLPATPVLLGAPLAAPLIWRGDGVTGPPQAVAARAQGLGALVAAPDGDGMVRRVPLLVVGGTVLRPGFAVEMVRLAQEASGLVVSADGRLHIGDLSAPVGGDAQLRLREPDPAVWRARSVSAAALLDGGAAAALAGKIVVVGGSAPELGGLRATPASAATPSVQIQAASVSALLRGEVAFRPGWVDAAEVAAAAGLGGLGLLLAVWRRKAAACVMVALCALWVFGARAAAGWDWLVDPAGPAAVALLAFAAAVLARFAADAWRARLLRASFEQHLAPEVVRRIAADPGALRLRGETREITALFTDIEGFTSMTERADPAELVALLDVYFDAATRVVTDHGGMVMKIVGDAVQGIFNAPLPLADHPARAVDCARALLAATEAVRRSPLGVRLALGRTRIGLETGMAVVGDIGGSRKLDYTAHGTTMNTAARLEAANKELGSSICIGPAAAGRLDPSTLRRIGTLQLRGLSRPVEVYTPNG